MQSNIPDINQYIQRALTSKNAQKPSVEALRELQRIENLDVSDFSEADVREEIINPILVLLGYQKGKYSSLDREKYLNIAGKKKFIDYSMKLWEKHYWLIEAKKPKESDSFSYEDLLQALEYSIHPTIDAVLVVLCDGIKLHIFDREESLTQPLYSARISNISNSFNHLSAILAPIHIWYFYKRRILRSIDKAFEGEFNQKRVDEFSDLISSSFQSKRSYVLKNMQSLSLLNNDSFISEIKKSSMEDIIDIQFFLAQTMPTFTAMTGTLVDLTKDRNCFFIPHRILPQQYRDYNDYFIVHSLCYFLQAKGRGIEFNNLPPLPKNSNPTVDDIIYYIAEICLTYSANDTPIRVILLVSNAYRRIFKVLSVVLSQHLDLGKKEHLVNRFFTDDFAWEQIVSSPGREILKNLERYVLIATHAFVKKYMGRHRDDFKINLSIEKLKSIWSYEIRTLESVPNYWQLRRELSLGEIFPTEHVAVSYNFLARYFFTMTKGENEFLEHIVGLYGEELKQLSLMGNQSASLLIGHKKETNSSERDEAIAQTFFLGNREIYGKLKGLYSPNQA